MFFLCYNILHNQGRDIYVSKLFLLWVSCDFGKARSNEEQGINGLKVKYQNVSYSHHITIQILYMFCFENVHLLQCLRKYWHKTGVTAAGDKHQWLTLTYFVFAVAGLISLWEVTIFNSCYVLSMETCLFFCHISSMDLEMAMLFSLSVGPLVHHCGLKEQLLNGLLLTVIHTSNVPRSVSPCQHDTLA